MSKFILLTLLLSSLKALEWLSYDEGLQQVEHSDKLLLLNFVRSSCHYCHDMEKQVFDNHEMAQFVTSCFIPVKVNLSIEPSPIQAKIIVTPTFIFMNKEQQIIKTIPGSWRIEDFRSLITPYCKKG